MRNAGCSISNQTRASLSRFPPRANLSELVHEKPGLAILILVEQGEGATFARGWETMEARSIARNRWGVILRAALLLAGLSTYLIFPDDVAWRFIKTAPHARVLEHVLFGIAAAFLGLALLLKVKASARPENHDSNGPSRITATVAPLLQAIGIGTLLPLPGFLLLVLGDVGISLLLYGRRPMGEDRKAEGNSRPARRPRQAFPWRNALATNIGLCFAFVSMAVFSIVLIDRVADVLFAMTALASIAASSRRFLSGYS
jgi:hypothetical protein